VIERSEKTSDPYGDGLPEDGLRGVPAFVAQHLQGHGPRLVASRRVTVMGAGRAVSGGEGRPVALDADVTPVASTTHVRDAAVTPVPSVTS
jgi:hypothetical protein